MGIFTSGMRKALHFFYRSIQEKTNHFIPWDELSDCIVCDEMAENLKDPLKYLKFKKLVQQLSGDDYLNDAMEIIGMFR